MATTVFPFGSSLDGPKWTVSHLVKNPMWVPQIVTRLVQDSNPAEWLLREGPTAVGGAVAFEEVQALYAVDTPDIVEEFGEIPMTTGTGRTPAIRQTVKRGIGFKLSEEMVSRNDKGRVKDEIEQIRRNIVLGRERALINAVLNHPGVLTGAAGNAGTGGWLTGTSSVISDVANATYEIASQEGPGALDEEKLGYDADIMIIHPSLEAGLIDNEEVNRIFAGSPLANQQLRIQGQLPRQFLNLTVMKSWRCPADKVVFAQRKAMGFISKEWPLRGSPLKRNDAEETYTSYFSYRELVAIDNPKSVFVLTGVNA
jgi:hypothetical protein